MVIISTVPVLLSHAIFTKILVITLDIAGAIPVILGRLQLQPVEAKDRK